MAVLVIVGAGVLRLIFSLFGSLAAAGIGGAESGFVVFGSMPWRSVRPCWYSSFLS